MSRPSEIAVLRQIAAAENIDASTLFICDGVVFRLSGESVTGTVCQVGTPYWDAAEHAAATLARLRPRATGDH